YALLFNRDFLDRDIATGLKARGLYGKVRRRPENPGRDADPSRSRPQVANARRELAWTRLAVESVLVPFGDPFLPSRLVPFQHGEDRRGTVHFFHLSQEHFGFLELGISSEQVEVNRGDELIVSHGSTGSGVLFAAKNRGHDRFVRNSG